MKTIISFSIFLFISSFAFSQKLSETITTNNFQIIVDDYKGAFHYSAGLRYRIGMVNEINNNPEWQYMNLGVIEGKKMSSIDFKVLSLKKDKLQNNVQTITAILRHKILPLEVTIVFSSFGETGVITSEIKLRNLSDTYSIRITDFPSFQLAFPIGEYEYSYMTCSWANERKMYTKPFSKDIVEINSTSGRSSTDYSPWISVHDKARNIYYNAQFAWSGNWSMKLNDATNGAKMISFSEYFDNNLLILLMGQQITLPTVALSGGYFSIDAPANNLHRYQREYLMHVPKTNDLMLVQFNTWFPLQIDVSEENLKPYIDVAADLGIEEFTIDAGWFVKKSFETEVGEWKTNRAKFPNGLRNTADYVRSKGMKFGIWFEIESVGTASELFSRHPEWCLQYNGKPVSSESWQNRRHLDFSNPAAFNWALEQFDNIYQECGGIDWVKLDYNVNIGSQFDNIGGIALGTALRNHILAYYKWLDTLHEKYPNLVLENCSSGALRMDIGILAHTHTSFVSDETSVNPSLGMAWSSTLEYTPRMINHWTVGMGNHYPIIDESLSHGYWDYMFRVPMNGQFGISSRITEWSPELKACAKENIALYKKIRPIIADADVYHLTPQPHYQDPEGWTVMAYIPDGAARAVVMANRSRGGEASYMLKLSQLKTNAYYRVEINGKNFGAIRGDKMAKEGMNIELDEYRASVIAFYER